MHKVYSSIVNAVKRAALVEPFSKHDFKGACPGFGSGTYNAFLDKHREGNPGGNSELFRRISPGRFSLLRPLKYGLTLLALMLSACSSPRQNADAALDLSLKEQVALIKNPTFSGFQFDKQVNDKFFYTGTTKEVYTDRTLTNTIRAEVHFQYVKIDLGYGFGHSISCTADLDRKTASCN